MSNSDLSTPDFVTREPARNQAPEGTGQRDLRMRIGRDGTWYYQGSPIRRQALVNLFARVLRREGDGSYWLVTPTERGRIEVEDAPFVVLTMTVAGEGEAQMLRLMTNIEAEITASQANPIRVVPGPDGAPRPYILVRPGLEALITRPVYYQLVDLGVIRIKGGCEELGVWSSGVFFPLGAVEAGDGGS